MQFFINFFHFFMYMFSIIIIINFCYKHDDAHILHNKQWYLYLVYGSHHVYPLWRSIIPIAINRWHGETYSQPKSLSYCLWCTWVSRQAGAVQEYETNASQLRSFYFPPMSRPRRTRRSKLASKLLSRYNWLV